MSVWPDSRAVPGVAPCVSHNILITDWSLACPHCRLSVSVPGRWWCLPSLTPTAGWLGAWPALILLTMSRMRSTHFHPVSRILYDTLWYSHTSDWTQMSSSQARSLWLMADGSHIWYLNFHYGASAQTRAETRWHLNCLFALRQENKLELLFLAANNICGHPVAKGDVTTCSLVNNYF